MPRFAVCIVLALTAVRVEPAAAQPAIEPKDGRVTIPLTLSPAAAPKPVSRYYLRPEYRDLQPGEKVAGFMKCFMEQAIFFNEENTKKRQAWLDMPLADLPAGVEQAPIHNGIAYDPAYASLMVYIDQAARYTRTEWNEWFNLRHDGINTLLPEVQQFRRLAPVVLLRMRGEVKSGEFQRATESAKTLFGMADPLLHHPTLIGNLVGIAIVSMALDGLEEMVQQPGCPNLFWSFVDLPTPLTPIRAGLAGERLFLTGQFGSLVKAGGPLSGVELDRHIEQITNIVRYEGGEPGSWAEQIIRNPRVRYTAWSLDKGRVADARKRLVELGGFKAGVVETFPPLQVVITDDLVQFEVLRDEQFKGLNLPYHQAAGLPDFEAQLKDIRRDLILAPTLLPAALKVKTAEARTDQRVAYLRIIEAVRLYAHANGGTLPNTLDAIKLPLPMDPFTGKPFEYAVKDGVATLYGANPQPDHPATNRRYELRLRK